MYDNVQRHPHTEWNVRRGFIHRRLPQNEYYHRKQAVYPKRPDFNSATSGKYKKPSICDIKNVKSSLNMISMKREWFKLCSLIEKRFKCFSFAC